MSSTRSPSGRARRTLLLSRLLFSMAIAGATIACGSGGEGDTGGTSSGGGGGGGADDDTTCLFRATLSGGVSATLGDVGQACVFSERTVGFVGLGEKVSLTLRVEGVERGQTGSFPASIDVKMEDDRWSGATCTLNVASNEKEPSLDAGGPSFDQYLLKGNGSCATPALYRADGGTKEPVTIGAFTFAFSSLFY